MNAHAPTQGKSLLDADGLGRTLSRIAHEIIEGNPELDDVALVGIQTRGVPLARRLARLIEERAGSRARARRRRHHLLPRRRHGPRRRGAARGAAARSGDAARLPTRRTDGRPRRRRPLHRPHDPRGDRGAVRLRPARPRPARRARRPRPPRAADPAGLRRQEPAHRARRADPGAARRGGRGRRRPARRKPGGGETDDPSRHRRPAPAGRPAEAAPPLGRRPDARRRRAAARHGAHVRDLARAAREEAADAQGAPDRQPLLRVVDPHVILVRARGEAALGGHAHRQVGGLLGGQGRVAQGHGAHARRLRPRRDRHPAPADRGAAARRRG